MILAAPLIINIIMNVMGEKNVQVIFITVIVYYRTLKKIQIY